MLLRSAGLFLFALQALTVLADDLSCDFRRPCCWQSLDENTKWQIRSGRAININEFRRTFLVGRSRLPPVGNYLLQSRRKGQATFGSCPFCSADGKVNVQYRHWQSPTARLMLCWRRMGQAIRSENCHPTEPSRQSQVISQNLMVPKGSNVQVLFVMEKADGDVNAVVMIDRILMKIKKCLPIEEKKEVLSRTASIPVAHSNNKTSHSSTTGIGKSSLPTTGIGKSSLPASSKIDPSRVAVVDDKLRSKVLEREDARKLIRQLIQEANTVKNKERRSGEVKGKEIERAGRSTEKMISTGETLKPAGLLSSVSVKRQAMRPPKRFIPDMEHSRELVGASVPPMPPPSPLAKPEQFDPLTDLLGKELVDFLDPNYVTKDDEEEPDYADEELETTTKSARIQVKPISKPSTVIVLHYWFRTMLFRIVRGLRRKHIALLKVSPTVVQTQSPLHVFNRPLSLAPPQPCHTFGGCLFDRTMCSFTHPPEVPIPNYFMRVRVGYSHFARARVAPGTTSVLETATNMLEPHTVFFDALEWQSGTRLIGCCSDRTGARQCPFATPVEAGVLLWQSASFDCPAYTVKISFICENFGIEDGECALDSVRLHRLSDTFLLEPCQKNILSSI